MKNKKQYKIILNFLEELYESDPGFTNNMLRTRFVLNEKEEDLPEDLIVNGKEPILTSSTLGVFNTLLGRLGFDPVSIVVDTETGALMGIKND